MTISKKKIIVGNWKMNGDLSLSREIIEGVAVASCQSSNQVIIVPPFIYLSLVLDITKAMSIQVGAQNMSQYEKGAYTGEVSGDMLADIGCQYVLVGHSERRQLFAENDESVAHKVKLALEKKIIPILCIGETFEEREKNLWKEVIQMQLNSVVRLCGIKAFSKIIIAYEPVWAIGTGESASAEVANEVHEYIYCTLANESDKIRDSLRVLYGGSVTADNSAQYMAMPCIDGVLVGGASLKPKIFSSIILSVE